jgi:hypothetical protein
MAHHPPVQVDVPVVITGCGYSPPEQAVAVQVDVAVRGASA